MAAEPSLPGVGPRDVPGSARKLRDPREIQAVLRKGRRLHSRRVVLYLAPAAGPTRAAALAGRRVGRAVARNRARRILREAWRRAADSVPEGYLVILVAQPEIRGARTTDLFEEVSELLAKAGVIGT